MTPEQRLEHVGHTVMANDCWEWNGGKHTDGYGVLNVWGKSMYAHRISLEVKLGRKLAPGMFACHTCDNPPCCNPDHLYEGTRRDNAKDSVSRGRHRHAVAGGYATYSPSVIDRVFDLADSGMKAARIAAEVGISQSYAYALLNGDRPRPHNYPKDMR